MSLDDRDIERIRAWREASARRYAEKRRRQPNPRLKQRGAKAKREADDIAAFRRAVRERSGGLCELDTPACPPEPHRGVHAHHMAPSDRDKGLHDPERGLFACHLGHVYVHTHPAVSYERGWLLKAAS